jgi:nucleoid DNA-binding protein
MSIKEWLIKRIAITFIVSEKIINNVITHQFDSANDAIVGNKSIEISGFGKFLFNQKKAEKQMDKYISQKKMYENILLDQEITQTKRKNTEVRLENTNLNIKFLKPKI